MLDSMRLRTARLLILLAAAALALPAGAQQGGFGKAGPSGNDPSGEGIGFRSDSRAPGGRQDEGVLDPAPAEMRSNTVPFPDDQQDFGAGSAAPARLELPTLSGFAAADRPEPLARREAGVTLAAKLTDEGGDVSGGLVWRIFSPAENAEGKLPLLASARGGTSSFDLAQGSYLVHASFGRAGATMRITVGKEPGRQTLVLDAGGLKLDAVVSGNHPIATDKVRFSIYEAEEDATGERALIIPDVNADAIVRLNAGTYHVVSTYGDVNAVIRADIRVEAGKLTEATVEHRAADLTLKLVREAGGEAMADTSWSVLTDGGDLVRESVGAYASMVLAEGSYTVVAKNRDRIYQRDIEVKAGEDKEVEVLTTDAAPLPSGEISD